VLVGLAKKLFVADVLALTVAERPDVHSAVHAWIVLLAFTFQIYFDFSAYTDVAIGFSRMLGIALPENFRRPYLAPNIREFWNRWHITLSTWVRDYIFLPTVRGLFRTRLPWPAVIATVSSPDVSGRRRGMASPAPSRVGRTTASSCRPTMSSDEDPAVHPDRACVPIAAGICRQRRRHVRIRGGGLTVIPISPPRGVC
jgi:hypothetical protein